MYIYCMKRYLSARRRSFVFAFRGLRRLLGNEPHIRIHFFATILVLLAGVVVELGKIEWLLVTVAIGIVWIAEIFNTVIEHLCDLYTTDRDERIRVIKDMSAGGVLVAAVIAAVIGCFVFIPRFFL